MSIPDFTRFFQKMFDIFDAYLLNYSRRVAEGVNPDRIYAFFFCRYREYFESHAKVQPPQPDAFQEISTMLQIFIFFIFHKRILHFMKVFSIFMKVSGMKL